MVSLLCQCLDHSLMHSLHNYPIAHAWGTAGEEEWNKRQRRRRWRKSRGIKIKMKDPSVLFKLIRIHVEDHKTWEENSFKARCVGKSSEGGRLIPTSQCGTWWFVYFFFTFSTCPLLWLDCLQHFAVKNTSDIKNSSWNIFFTTGLWRRTHWNQVLTGLVQLLLILHW